LEKFSRDWAPGHPKAPAYVFADKRIQFVYADDESEERCGSVGELEMTPVSAAIARHLNIDLSQEGRAARNRRGIALIVHGAPMSGNCPALNEFIEIL